MPTGFLAVAWLLGLLLLKPKKTRLPSRILLVASFLLFYALGTWPVANLLLDSLQSGLPSPGTSGALEAEAIVVLSGGSTGPEDGHPFPELTQATWRRLWRGVEVYDRLGGKAPLLYSGTDAMSPTTPNGGDSSCVPAVARRLGIREDSLWVEGRSLDTYQSAVEVKKLLDSRYPGGSGHAVVLVTSAWHMPRALRAFRGQGLSVVPEAADYRSGPRSLALGCLVPSYEALSASSIAIREMLGLVAYRILGRT
jgi:uncharacterized SAM-binding protein YcdF (DUF218 family)